MDFHLHGSFRFNKGSMLCLLYPVLCQVSRLNIVQEAKKNFAGCMALVTTINKSDECLWKCQNLNKYCPVKLRSVLLMFSHGES